MNKKEVTEIKKQFTPSNCAITRICGCYVDGEKEKKTELKEAFLSLPEDEMFKYFDIFRKTLSGTVGKNLLNMEFPLETEAEGGTQEFLLKLRSSRLTDDELLEQFYDKVIEAYDYGENYLILLIHAAYDIPGKSSDGSEMFDASDEVYDYILCSICPVKLSKPALSYHAEENSFHDRIRDWIVEMPDVGFLFPAFNDRSTDIHNLLYYSKNAEQLQANLAEQLLGCVLPLSAGGQKETFRALIEETLGDECEYEIVKNIHENLNELIEQNADNPEPLSLDKAEVKYLLAKSGVEEEKLENFEQQYSAAAGEHTSLLASNVADTKKFEIKTPDITIHVKPECAALVETRVIDGRNCIVIGVDDRVEINGITARTVVERNQE
ncbi:DUF4317 domain-containing protein [Bariatricus massiliensis]|uniref:DUF4317 domain-containing protein n=1 Tax=Bariatricus massiliensis TaxID=1745713 RepID=A0ABS8DEX2_9FIRM|nr:DUF4317 domain-containing protein [Bariatricus massiliensis]MCB7303080.1 DUF4317 domain-containing protein [Bariatricus massiliensis]MCB7374296.1 DUF4317 domain-containing protein [Bariatricus massiliensis]MCB7386966.1 DUF4317 domain-containing protein [Bariatricus massiliensis]MCB7411128.1 DUF4317 domain-containing protein [Bariatricus massiliensis]MCQ5251954.1 DUF4317 domain-containing protein [Bariatricus massiliensis]